MYGTCKLHYEHSDNRLNKKRCEIINKQLDNKDTVHWGNYCTKKDEKGKDVFIPVKNVCEANGHTWQEVYTNGVWNKGCIDKKSNKSMKDNKVCGLLKNYTVSSAYVCICVHMCALYMLWVPWVP